MHFRNLRKFFRKRYRDVFGTSITGTTAAQIQAMREKRGWSQQELANNVGMGQARISLLENPNYQNLSLTTLKRIANVFDVALLVRFVPFSKLFEMLDSETEHTLSVPSFEDEFGTERIPIVTPIEKIIDIRERLKELRLDGPSEGIARLTPDLLYDPRRLSGATAIMTTPPAGTLCSLTNTYGPSTLGADQYGNILYATHPLEAGYAR
jgi:transcriptional regulator with XRE-family HTH domain